MTTEERLADTERRLSALYTFTHSLMANIPIRSESTASTASTADIPFDPTLFSGNPDAPHLQQLVTLRADSSDSIISRMPSVMKVKLSMNGKNYSTWKTSLDALLLAEMKCYEVTHGTLPESDPAYKKSNDMAKGLITNSLEGRLLNFTFKETLATVTAASMYTTITDRFDNMNQMARNTIMQKISTFKFNTNRTPIENLDRFRTLVSDAIDAGASPSDSSLVPALLQALPDSWFVLRQSWSTVIDETITNLYAHIEKEQFRLQSAAQARGTNPSNNFAVYYSEVTITVRGSNDQSSYYRSQNQNRNNDRFRNNSNRRNSGRQFQPRFPNNPRYQNNQNQNRNQYSQNYNNNPRRQNPSQNQREQSLQPYQPNPSYNNRQNSQNRGRGRGRSNNQNRNPNPRAHFAEVQGSPEPYYSPEIFAVSASGETHDPSMWLVDSGASEHFCRSRDAFFNYQELPSPLVVRVGGSQTLQAVGTGTVLLRVQSTSNPTTLSLDQVLHVPGLRRNLISVSAMLRDGWTVRADNTSFILSNETDTITAQPNNGLFTLHARILNPSFEHEVHVSLLKKNPTLQQAHEILGHINKASVQKLMRKYGLKYKPDREDCEPCLRGKMNRASYHSRPLSAQPN